MRGSTQQLNNWLVRPAHADTIAPRPPAGWYPDKGLRKGQVISDALVCISHTLKSALKSRQVARIVLMMDISAAFDGVSCQIILYKLCSVGIGSSVLLTLTQFLSNRSQHVNGWRSKLVYIVSGMAQGSVWVRYCSSWTTRIFFSILENKLMVPLWWPLYHHQALGRVTVAEN